MKWRMGDDRAIESRHHGYVSSVEGNDGIGIDGGADRLHEEESKDEEESDKRLIGGRGLGAERVAEKMKDDDQAHERRHRENDGRNHGQQGEQYDDVPGGRTAGRGPAGQETGDREAGRGLRTRPERRGGYQDQDVQ
jgi:hypothetical protein